MAVSPPPADGAEAREFLEQLGLPIFKIFRLPLQGISKRRLYQGTRVKEVPEDRGVLGWKDYELDGK